VDAVDLAERSDRTNLKGRVWGVLAQAQRDKSGEAVGSALHLYEAKGNFAAAAHLRETVVG